MNDVPDPPTTADVDVNKQVIWSYWYSTIHTDLYRDTVLTMLCIWMPIYYMMTMLVASGKVGQ